MSYVGKVHTKVGRQLPDEVGPGFLTFGSDKNIYLRRIEKK